MKISSITNSFLPRRIQNRNTTTPFIQNNNIGDVFVSFKNTDFPTKILKNKKKFDISDYKKLTKKEIEEIKRTKCTEISPETINDNIEIAIDLKKKLDEEYGEGNYIFECIGTSPSALARVFEFMGVETHYIPISDLSNKNSDRIDFLLTHYNYLPQKEKYTKYLAQQGIKPDMTKDNDKHYLFFDYTYTGDSLKTFEEILKKYFNIPNDKNVEFLSINKKLRTLYNNKNLENKKYANIMNYIERYFRLAHASEIGGIPHLRLDQLEDIEHINKFDKFSWKDYQAYNFLVIDKLNEMGLLKENPANSVNIL